MKVIVAFDITSKDNLWDVEKRILEIHSNVNPDLIIIDDLCGSNYLYERLKAHGIKASQGNVRELLQCEIHAIKNQKD